MALYISNVSGILGPDFAICRAIVLQVIIAELC